MKNLLTVHDILTTFKNIQLIYENKKNNIQERYIKVPGVNRAGLELSGFVSAEDDRKSRVILLSTKESEYLTTVDAKDLDQHLENVLHKNVPVIFLSESFKFATELVKIAQKIKSEVPIIQLPFRTYEFNLTIAIYISDRLALTTVEHGTLLNIFGIGVLIKGESGIGKSETALELLRFKHLFVGDDSIEVFKSNNKIIGRPCPLIKNFIEIRGIGILDVSKMYGYHLIKNESEVNLIVELKRYNDVEWIKLYNKGIQENYETFFGINIHKTIIPVTSGRNLADLIETAVVNLKLIQNGVNSNSDFENYIKDELKK